MRLNFLASWTWTCIMLAAVCVFFFSFFKWITKQLLSVLNVFFYIFFQMSLTITVVDFYNVIAKWLIWTWNLLIFSCGCSSTCDLLLNKFFRFMTMNAVYWILWQLSGSGNGWRWGQIVLYIFCSFIWNFDDYFVEFKVRFDTYLSYVNFFNDAPLNAVFYPFLQILR